LTGQEHPKTSIVYEFPRAEGDPYYPIPRKENADLYAKYKTLADQTEGVHFVGRLATYKYYNMDQVVAQALTVYAKICGDKRSDAVKRVELKTYSHGNGNARAGHEVTEELVLTTR
jgi:UDP-galactopyranose mutase